MTEAMTEAMTADAVFELLTLDHSVDSYGAAYYYNALGELHRVYGPAVEWADGSRAWCQNGLLHRMDGPAIEFPDGRCAWYINGEWLTETEWQQQVASMENV